MQKISIEEELMLFPEDEIDEQSADEAKSENFQIDMRNNMESEVAKHLFCLKFMKCYIKVP